MPNQILWDHNSLFWFGVHLHSQRCTERAHALIFVCFQWNILANGCCAKELGFLDGKAGRSGKWWWSRAVGIRRWWSAVGKGCPRVVTTAFMKIPWDLKGGNRWSTVLLLKGVRSPDAVMEVSHRQWKNLPCLWGAWDGRFFGRLGSEGGKDKVEARVRSRDFHYHRGPPYSLVSVWNRLCCYVERCP